MKCIHQPISKWYVLICVMRPYEHDDDLNEDDSKGERKLIITSTAGQVIQIVDLQNNSGVVQLNTTDWAGGIYFATLFSNKTKGTVYKFVVRKNTSFFHYLLFQNV